MAKNILIISGEVSGDMHGASLMEAIKERITDVSFFGMGGAKMREAGLKGLDFKEVSVVGLVEVLKKIPEIRARLKELKTMIKAENIDLVVLIDFPDFNLRVAAEAKKLGIPVAYYISPQVWAWRKGRIKKIAALVDKMLVILPFEEELYRAEGVDVEFVGHPLADTAVCDLTLKEAKAELGYKHTVSVVSILPGSRVEEVTQMLPPMLDGAALAGEYSRWVVKFILHAADSIEDDLINELIKDHPIKNNVQIVRGKTRLTALRASDAAIITSGTATLEALLIGTPMAICYKLSYITYAIARFLLRIKYIGLPNIILNRGCIDELWQHRVNEKEISEVILKLLEAPNEVEHMMEGYKEIQDSLGNPGASKKAALAVCALIGE
jgi:lipid-A-disaccharide synthase